MKYLIFVLWFGLNASVMADQYWSTPSVSAKQSNFQPSFQLDIDALNTTLSLLSQQPSVIITLPRADGSLSQFSVSSTQVMAAELAYKYPNIKTYKIQHVSDKNVRGRMELIDDQLTVLIKTATSQELLNPSNTSLVQNYAVKNKGKNPKSTFSCGTMTSDSSNKLAMKFPNNSQYRSAPNTLKKLRVAIATTVEYSQYFGVTKAAVLGEITRTLNRINEVYESELAITLELVSGNENIIFLDTDSYINDDADQMLDVNRSIIDNAIGNANYDLGHVFSTGGGGLAQVGYVCSTSSKASGVTGRSTPTGDAFWIDFVAHEMGHQLGAEHTFNGTTASCGGFNREANTAYEPGSGSTIMAYAGICGNENLQSNSDDSFHFASKDEINAVFTANPKCGVSVDYSSVHSGLSNANAPVVTAGANYDIPIKTPFMLTASSTDADNDTLFYQWDGIDKGKSTNANTFGCDDGSRALFRSNKPQTKNTRYFPSLATLLKGVVDNGEVLPTTSRDINFKLTVTDKKGGLDTDSILLRSHLSIGAFSMTSQTTQNSYSAKQSVPISWDVANTISAPVTCSTVDVELLSMNADSSRFSKLVLANGLANNGFASVSLPDVNSSINRFLVKCSNNVFFTINASDFSITGGSVSASTNAFSTGLGQNTLSTSPLSPTALTCDETQVSDSNSSGGGGGFPIYLLLVLSGLFLTRRHL